MDAVKEVTGSRFFLHIRRPEEAKRFEYWIIEKGGIVSIFLDGSESVIVTDDPLYNKYREKIVSYLVQHPTSKLFFKLPAPLREAIRAKVPIVSKDEFKQYVEKVDPRFVNMSVFPVMAPMRSQETVPTEGRYLRKPYLIVRDEDRKYRPLIYEPLAKCSSEKPSSAGTSGKYSMRPCTVKVFCLELCRTKMLSKTSRLSLAACPRKIRGYLKHKISAAESFLGRKRPRRHRTIRYKVCKLCKLDFVDLKEHLESPVHRHVVQSEDTWKALDEAHNLCPSFDDFLQQLPVCVQQENSEEVDNSGSIFEEQKSKENYVPMAEQQVEKENAGSETPENVPEKDGITVNNVQLPNSNTNKETVAEESEEDALIRHLLQRCVTICDEFDTKSEVENSVSCSSQFEEVVKAIVKEFTK
ncbi:Protein DBF4 like protein B [Trichuris trichiura]|uniref:Protein DBF4 like protein B n=1 Tax=Trichuris trichiura TaxID=36087 RepID=A0A077YWV1_TRITR|nr:Protein DBF4 like protein B [Trichuris trichiura]